jgi:aconitate hydratase
MTIYDAAMRYKQDGTPLVILAGKEYGSGSSRDWAAKGPYLQGIKAAIAESYERIHRSNLIGMGVLPLQFRSGDTVDTLGLTGHETFDIQGVREGIASGFKNGRQVTVRAVNSDGDVKEFTAEVRLDTPQEVLYYLNGGILQYVLRQLVAGRDQTEHVSKGLAAAPQRDSETAPNGKKVDEGSVESFPASDPPAY